MRIAAWLRVCSLGALTTGGIVGSQGCSSEVASSGDGEFGSISAAVCSSVTLAPSPASPQEPGSSILIQSNASCAGGETPHYRFLVKAPWTGWTVLQDYSPLNSVTWNTTGLNPAIWKIEVDVRAAGSAAAWEAWRSVDFRLGSAPTCTATTVVLSPASTASVGTSVGISSTGTCDSGANPQFKFIARDPKGIERVVRDYATAATATWDTSLLATGNWTVIALVRPSASSAPYTAFAQKTFSLSAGAPGPCTAVDYTTNPASTASTGTAVGVSATATCEGGSVPEYQFSVRLQSGAWRLLQDYSTSSTYSWASSGYAEGGYTLQVAARRQGSTSTSEVVWKDTPYTLTGPAGGACNAVTLGFSPSTGQPAGTPITLTGAATCTGTAAAEYKFEYFKPAVGWTQLRDWGAASMIWDTTGLTSGNYPIQVLARAAGSSATWESFQWLNFAISASQRSCATAVAGCGMASTAGGAFTMGEVGAARAEPVQPSITVGPFSLDAYEVSVARFRTFWDAGHPAPTARLVYPNGTAIDFAGTVTEPIAYATNLPHCTWSTTAGTLESHPLTCVDWWTAQAFCAWDGGRLPTEAEWEWMGRGRTGADLVSPRSYPYGNTPAATTCDVAQWNGCSGDDSRMTKHVGSFAANGGVYDLGGNVWEWMADTWGDYSSSACWGATPRSNPLCFQSPALQRTIRGGSWFDTVVDYQRSAWRSNKNYPTYQGPGTGFRCARQ